MANIIKKKSFRQPVYCSRRINIFVIKRLLTILVTDPRYFRAFFSFIQVCIDVTVSFPTTENSTFNCGHSDIEAMKPEKF